MSKMNRHVKNTAKKGLEILHRAALRAGLIVLPNHYYVPIADRRELARTKEFWAKKAPLHGVKMDVTEQLEALRSEVAPFEPEYRGNARNAEGVARGYGPGFGYVEAQCLHGVVRALKPRRVMEVGSGVSTFVMLGALELNAQDGPTAEVTCIEPYPRTFLREEKSITLVEAQVQHLDPAIFDQLEAGDFLFIDSTHAVKPAGDVEYLYLSVIPRLKPGVVIHIHDIAFPYLYLPPLLHTIFQWTEGTLLAALLTNNSHLSVRYCLSLLHHEAPVELATVFPEYRPRQLVDGLSAGNETDHYPSSIYLTTH